MIRIHPAWEGEKQAEILALYEFLLYQTLPFPPSAFLPEDAHGFYYYQDGNPQNPKTYPASRPEREECTKTLICKVSPELCNWLYCSPENSLRTQLRKLLLAIPSQKEWKELRFAPRETWKPLREGVFNYDKFSRNKLFPKLVQLLDVPVCPYCNRAFTTTARKTSGAYHRQNQIDHFLPKSQYPWLALSLPNLIPACGNCNQKKGDRGEVLYPYEEEFGERYRFRSVPISGVGYLIGQAASLEEFQIELERVPGGTEDHDYHTQVQNARDCFGLDALYQSSHNAYVAGIYAQRYVFGEAYIQSLMDSFPDLFSSPEEVRRMLYLREIDETLLHQSPLAKLTCDIDREITKSNTKTTTKTNMK